MSEKVKLTEGMKLTEGIEATEDGLLISKDALVWLSWYAKMWAAQSGIRVSLSFNEANNGAFLWEWDEARELFLYRLGAPWCDLRDGKFEWIECFPGDWIPNFDVKHGRPLARVAALCCGGPKEYKALYNGVYGLPLDTKSTP